MAVEILSFAPEILDSERQASYRNPPETAAEIFAGVVIRAELVGVVVHVYPRIREVRQPVLVEPMLVADVIADRIDGLEFARDRVYLAIQILAGQIVDVP